MAEILVVDDEVHARRLLTELLHGHGHHPLAASSVAQARETLLARPDIALVLADVRMPHESGIALARHVASAHPDVAVVMVSGDEDPETARVAIELGAYGFVLKPFRPRELIVTVLNALRRRQAEVDNRRHREQLEQIVADRTAELTSAMRLLERANARLTKVQEEIIRRLSIASEMRDQETGAHITRMSRYSAVIAKELGFASEDVDLIQLASPLHDVGKIGVSDRILRKPGRHTREEFEEMKRHTIYGYQTLAGTDLPLLNMAATIAYTHHERWDGTGYPRGLCGAAIPLEGRIVAVADVFDALMTKRVYKPAFTIDRALQILRDGRESHFDPVVLDCFLRRIDEVVAINSSVPDDAPLREDGFALHRFDVVG